MLKINALFIVFSLLAFPAYALKITNLDDKTQIVSVDFYGEVMEVTLPPKRSRHIYGRAHEIILGKQEIYLMNRNLEYCIRDGSLSLQRRMHRSKYQR